MSLCSASAKIAGVSSRLFEGANSWRGKSIRELHGDCGAFADVIDECRPETGDACAGLVSNARINDPGGAVLEQSCGQVLRGAVAVGV